jgi:DNA-binding IclR family transcriptional regulator
MSIDKNNTMIQSLQVGMSIIDLIASKDQPLKFSEIQEQTQITKSNLYKYLNTLTHLQLLHRNKKDGSYVLGSKIIEYGRSAIGGQDLIATATPYLQELSFQTNLTALLTVATPNGPIVANIWHSNNVFNIGAQIGSQLPIFSATGKVFSAYSASVLLQEWKNKELLHLSSEMKDQLAEAEQIVSETGIAFSKEALVPHVTSAASPLFDYKNELIGTVNLIGFIEYFPQSVEHEFSQQLINVSREISSLLGYTITTK